MTKPIEEITPVALANESTTQFSPALSRPMPPGKEWDEAIEAAAKAADNEWFDGGGVGQHVDKIVKSIRALASPSPAGVEGDGTPIHAGRER